MNIYWIFTIGLILCNSEMLDKLFALYEQCLYHCCIADYSGFIYPSLFHRGKKLLYKLKNTEFKTFNIYSSNLCFMNLVECSPTLKIEVKRKFYVLFLYKSFSRYLLFLLHWFFFQVKCRYQLIFNIHYNIFLKTI